ncbi:MAG: AEC family transporter [Beijerinckiaceae bacterium]|nr:AEC family transporter [Beijerinckiaceae bacterium]
MSAIVTITFPIFALILAGFISAKAGILDLGATDALNRFVVYLALPSLLFQATAHVTLGEINQPGFALAFAVGIAITFALSALATRPKGLADASILGLNASYANVGFMGIPLCLSIFGEASLPALVIATIMTAAILFAIAIAMIETELNRDGSVGRTVVKVGGVLIRNPLVIAPFCGMLVVLAGAHLPEAIDRFVKLLGAAASPCALVTIGLFIGQQNARFDRALVWKLVLLKLIVQPAITYVLAFHVFSMPALWAEMLVILSALPTGTGPFMLAKLHDRQSSPTSGAILVSTVLSVVTISGLLAVFRAS